MPGTRLAPVGISGPGPPYRLRMAALALLWGAAYPVISVALRGYPPVLVVLARVTLAALCLMPLALHRHALAPLLVAPGWALLAVLLQATAPLLLLTYGQQRLPVGPTAVLIGCQPIFVALLATRLDPAERVRGPVGLAGLSIGLGGLLLIFGVDIRGDSRELLGGLLVTAAALCYAVGSLLIHRRLAFAQPLGVASAAMVVAAIVVTAAALVMPGLLALPAGRPSIASTMALIALGTVFTALTLRLFYGLIADVGPARAALAFYLSPGVAVLLGWALLGETISPCIVLGLLAVVVGSALAARR